MRVKIRSNQDLNNPEVNAGILEQMNLILYKSLFIHVHSPPHYSSHLALTTAHFIVIRMSIRIVVSVLNYLVIKVLFSFPDQGETEGSWDGKQHSAMERTTRSKEKKKKEEKNNTQQKEGLNVFSRVLN